MATNEIDAFINQPVFSNNFSAVSWLMEMNLIEQVKLCDICGRLMEIRSLYLPLQCCKYLVCEWYCRFDGSRKSFTSNTFLSIFYLYPMYIVVAIHTWSFIDDNMIFKRLADAYPPSQSFWFLFNFISVKYFELNPVRMGGKGATILSDVSCGSFQVSHLKGADAAEILCFYDINSIPIRAYMEIIRPKDKTAISRITERVVVPGTDIRSNQSLLTMEYKVIDAYWERHSNIRREINRCSLDHLDGYLKQLMWQDRFGDDDVLMTFCDHLRKYGNQPGNV